MNLSGKNIIITGAKRIGQTVAIELAERGANLAIIYRSSESELEELMNELAPFKIRTISIQADLSNEKDIKNVVQKTSDEFGQIHGLVHMAAPYPRSPLGRVTMDQFDNTFRAIAASAILLGQEVGLKMRENKSLGNDIRGKIVFFSDWSVLRHPFPDYVVYNAAKAAIDSITKSLAIELAPSVTVNAIAPGPILKPPDLSDSDNKKVLAQTPLGRWGGGEEIAKAVLYLLDSDFVTGVVLPVDGGRSIA